MVLEDNQVCLDALQPAGGDHTCGHRVLLLDEDPLLWPLAPGGGAVPEDNLLEQSVWVLLILGGDRSLWQQVPEPVPWPQRSPAQPRVWVSRAVPRSQLLPSLGSRLHSLGYSRSLRPPGSRPGGEQLLRGLGEPGQGPLGVHTLQHQGEGSKAEESGAPNPASIRNIPYISGLFPLFTFSPTHPTPPFRR